MFCSLSGHFCFFQQSLNNVNLLKWSCQSRKMDSQYAQIPESSRTRWGLSILSVCVCVADRQYNRRGIKPSSVLQANWFWLQVPSSSLTLHPLINHFHSFFFLPPGEQRGFRSSVAASQCSLPGKLRKQAPLPQKSGDKTRAEADFGLYRPETDLQTDRQPPWRREAVSPCLI